MRLTEWRRELIPQVRKVMYDAQCSAQTFRYGDFTYCALCIATVSPIYRGRFTVSTTYAVDNNDLFETFQLDNQYIWQRRQTNGFDRFVLMSTTSWTEPFLRGIQL